ncbi:MAG: multidrug efflux SMR transporter [Pseudanabaenaceae cyanobacterium bins.39]|nr:multidrug efflux SMR transporter [Pseudanabaenaceae cyanobacterium bins.39]
MDWINLVIAGLLEAVWANSLKYTEGFTKLVPSLITLASLSASFVLLAESVKTIPVGIAYSIWTGIGVVGTAIVGTLFFGEPHSFVRGFCISLIVMGIIGLRFLEAR